MAKILVVDDEVQYVDVVAFKFRNAGLEVVTARDGQEALLRAAAEPLALVISDYQMPVIDGVELCRRLRASPATADVPFILLTAFGLDLDEDALASSGVTAVMSKPFSPRELLGRASELMASSQPCAARTE